MKIQLLVGAASSGSGKTTFTLGLLRALKNRGMKVQAFKTGPDYIDTKYHKQACGLDSINLDMFMASDKHIKNIYQKYARDKDVCIVEGVMGLFDGSNKMNASSASLAELLNIPIILLINAKSTAYSVAAMIYGFKNFYKNINIAGVVFNFVGSENHYSFLKDACKDVGVEALGYIPKTTLKDIPSRHLGLSLEANINREEITSSIASQIEKTVDLNRIIELYSVDFQDDGYEPNIKKISGLNISVADDEAFNFYYKENISILKNLGKVSFFSPIKDKNIPTNTDFLYLPGGYPEFYLKELSANTSMLNSINSYCDNGGHCLAECGGMMYLSNNIVDENGTYYPMTRVINHNASMQNMKLHLGYRRIDFNNNYCKGHEFHYSSIIDPDSNITKLGKAYSAKGLEVDTALFKVNNTYAGYTHIYWADNVKLIEDIIKGNLY